MGNCVAKNSRLEENAFFKGTTRGSTQKSAAAVKHAKDPVNTVPAVAPAAVAANARPAVAASTANNMDIHAMSDRLQKLRSYNNKGSAPVASPKPALSPANSMDDTTLTVLAPIMNFQRAIASPAHTESKTLFRAATMSRTNSSRYARTDSRLHSVPPPTDEDVAQAVVQIKDRERFVQLAHNIFCSQPFEQLLARASGDVMLVRQIHFNAIVSEKEHPTITLFTRMPLRLEGKEARAALLWLIQKSYDTSTRSFDAVHAKAAMREVAQSVAAAC